MRLLGASETDSVRDLVLLLCRALLGAVLIAHGWQKIDAGQAAVAASFDDVGVPLPGAAAFFATAAEFGGGILLILGLLAPLAGLSVAVTMAGAFWFTHRGAAIFTADDGWELAAAIGVGALGFGLLPGRLSLDHLIQRLFVRHEPSRSGPAAPASPASPDPEPMTVPTHAGGEGLPRFTRTQPPHHPPPSVEEPPRRPARDHPEIENRP